MNRTIERRIETLESQSVATDGSIAVVFVKDGETKSEALGRAGVDPEKRLVIVVSFK